jgi:hypothetical protein
MFPRMTVFAALALASALTAAPEIKSVDVGGKVAAIRALPGSQAFVAAGRGVAVVDLFDASLSSKIEVPGEALDVDVDYILSCGILVRKIGVLTEGQLHLVDPRTQTVEKSFAVPAGAHDLRLAGNRAVMFAGHGLVAIDLESGAEAWKLTVPGMPGGLAIRGDEVVVGHAYPGGLKVVDLASGEVKASHRTDWIVSLAIPEFGSDIAFVTTSTGAGVQAIELATGRVVAKKDERAHGIGVDFANVVTSSPWSSPKLEVRNRESLDVIRSIPLPERPTTMSVSGGFAVVGTESGALKIVPLFDPES